MKDRQLFIMTAGFILPILHLRPVLHIAWECLQQMKILIFFDPKSWTKERYPVLRTDESRGIYGPGHNSFTEDEEGNPIMVYHARTEAEIEGNPLYNPNRHAMLMKIRWDEKTGAPIFLTKIDVI